MVFTKLHATILDSSVWQEPAHVRLVWITMLAMAGHDGVVQASVGGLAHRARVTREECAQALALFMGPDPDSRDRTTGERIEEVPGGWLVLNHANYRDRQTREQALTAARVARHRARKAAGDADRYVTLDNATSPNISAHPQTSRSEAEISDAEGSPPLRGSPQTPLCAPGVGSLDALDALEAVEALEAAEYQPDTAAPSKKRSSRSGAPRAIPVDCPGDVEPSLWQEWCAFRRTKRAPVTQRVIDSTRKTATAAGMSLSEALTYWMQQGHVGFFPPAPGAARQGGATFDRSGVIMKSAPPGYYSGPAVQGL